MSIQTITISATDGFDLEASLFEPDTEEEVKRTVIIASATAVRRLYYKKFALFLAKHNLRVLNFDYRGIGGSKHGDIRDHTGTMLDWAEKDLGGVIDYVKTSYPDSVILVVGHSAGGQFVGLTDRNRFISGMLAVCAQSGYWKHWDVPLRYVMMGVWYVLVPLLTRIFSYFPTKAIGMGENLLAGVALEWARWCRNKNYFVDKSGQPIAGFFEGVRFPIRSYSFSDDNFAPEKAVNALMALYKHATVAHRHLSPKDMGENKIGHFGFFREKFRDTLWTECVTWLLNV